MALDQCVKSLNLWVVDELQFINILSSANTEQILLFIRELVRESTRRCGQSKEIVDYINTFLREKLGIEINEKGEFFIISKLNLNDKTPLEIKEIVQDVGSLMYVNPIFRGRNFKIEKNLCFVLMPFRDQFLRIFNDHIKPTLEELGFKVVKADDIFKTRSNN